MIFINSNLPATPPPQTSDSNTVSVKMEVGLTDVKSFSVLLITIGFKIKKGSYYHDYITMRVVCSGSTLFGVHPPFLPYNILFSFFSNLRFNLVSNKEYVSINRNTTHNIFKIPFFFCPLI